MPINMITIRIKTLLLALLSAMCAEAQSADRHAIVVDQNIKTNPAKGEFATVNEALRKTYEKKKKRYAYLGVGNVGNSRLFRETKRNGFSRI